MTTEGVRPKLLWSPAPEAVADTAMARFVATAHTRGHLTEPTYAAAWEWSVAHPEQFWPLLAEFFAVRAAGSWAAVRDREDLSGAGWFPEVRLNYAANVFARVDPARPALLVLGENRPCREVGWEELAAQVASLADHLRSLGVQPGDRVAAYLPNCLEAVVGLLATAAVGALWACCAPDYGVEAVVDRLAQIEPRVLILTGGYHYGGRAVERSAEAVRLLAELPSVQNTIWTGDGTPAVPATTWSQIMAARAELTFTEVAFDHPLWILYSSGTTGLPKGIVHSHGGIVLEHLKWWGLHNDVRPGDRFFWYSSTAWMVWNAAVSTLLTGATVVIYDGSPNWPTPDQLWRLAAQTRTTHLGTSAAYLTMCQRAAQHPGRDHDLTQLRWLMSSGSVLPTFAWQWVYDRVKADLHLDAPSGGTDVCTPYVGANPMAAVHAGEMQCRFLGTRVESWREDGTAARDEIGELVVTAPMPSMPLRFWNDPDGTRLHEAYFDHFPGVWRHGDWITITERGSALVHGRSDNTINRHGVRLGSADIYAALEPIPEITDSLVVGVELDEGAYWMPLFVSLLPGSTLDEHLQSRVDEAIRTACSARHVPDEILEVAAVPRTLTGKRLEVPVKRILQGTPLDRAVNAGVVDRPDVLSYFVELGARRRRPATELTARES